LSDVSTRLKNSIDKLDSLVTPVGDTLKEIDLYAEHSGLMGSAYKRTAEHLYLLSSYNPEMAEILCKESSEALVMARKWYYNGYKKTFKNHWTGIQYLSLAAVTNKTLNDEEDQDIWTHVKILAQADENAEDIMARIWAWGTLSELFLLKPLTKEPDQFEKEAGQAMTRAKEYAGRIRDADTTFIDRKDLRGMIQYAQQTTRKQIDRYITWWPVMIPGASLDKLKSLAEGIVLI